MRRRAFSTQAEDFSRYPYTLSLRRYLPNEMLRLWSTGSATRSLRLECSRNPIAFITPFIPRRPSQPSRHSIQSRIASYQRASTLRRSPLSSHTQHQIDGVMSSGDIVIGVLIALSLVRLSSSLQNRSLASKADLDATLEEQAVDVFKADAWKDISRPENYVLYNTRVRNKLKNSKLSLPIGTVFTSEKKVVAIALLLLFVPIFSFEFFLALSRQIVCGDSPLSLAGWALELCSPHIEP